MGTGAKQQADKSANSYLANIKMATLKSRNLRYLTHAKSPSVALPLSPSAARHPHRRLQQLRNPTILTPPSETHIVCTETQSPTAKPLTAFSLQRLAARTMSFDAPLRAGTTLDTATRRGYSHFTQQTAKENERIRAKLAEYSRLAMFRYLHKIAQSPRRQDSGKAEAALFDPAIKEKLQEQATRINIILAKQSIIKSISPYSPDSLGLPAGAKYFGKIRCAAQSTPLIVRVQTNKGAGHITAYLSLDSQRPDAEDNDKTAHISKPMTYITLPESNPRAVIFSHAFVYIAFETRRDSSITFECSFGRRNNPRSL